MGDRVSFLEHGRIVQTGAAIDVFAHPASASFADFLGLDAYLEGEIVNADDGSTTLRLTSGMEIACREAADGPAVACLPPEDVILFTGRPRRTAPASGICCRDACGQVRPVGTAASRRSVAAGEIEVAALVTRAAFDDLGLAVGSDVIAAFKASAVHPIPRYERHPPSPEVRAT